MKTPLCFVAIALLCFTMETAWAQAGSSAERRAFREYTSPQELVSISPSTPLDKALTIISEVSKKFVGKVIVDTEHRTTPIRVDIQGYQWRDALEAICRKNDLWYTEYESYIQITGGPSSTGPAASTASAPGMPGKELASLRSREISIRAYFFEVNLSRMEEVGLNWNFMKSTDKFAVDASFGGGDKMLNKIFKAEVTPKLSFANITAIAQLFSSYSLGDILSGPQLIVRSGEEGRIQVGQDFSVKERDFAGNVMDKFYSTGTIIKVTPQVITEQGVNFIHLVVDVERSNVQPGTISTIINKTKANTNVLLLDGEETIIGGLYSVQTSTVRNGVPFLKDLPWYVFGLRYIFGYNRDEEVKQELIILLKAELVPTLQERITQKAKEDGVFDRWLDKNERMERHIKGTK